MGLMDKVRAQSTQLAQKAQETAREGKVKLDQANAKRRADAMFRDLGATVYAERTGRGTPDSKEKIDRLVDALSRRKAPRRGTPRLRASGRRSGRRSRTGRRWRTRSASARSSRRSPSSRWRPAAPAPWPAPSPASVSRPG